MNKNIFLLTDLGFGDAGKGSITSAICQKNDISLVVRYNGGAQACHTVVTNGLKHQFHLFGSGTLDKVPTLLSQFVVIDPISLFSESMQLEKLLGYNVDKQLFIDPECLVTTSYHKLVNRARERNRKVPHGTCGLGIGATMEFYEFDDLALKVQDLRNGNFPVLLQNVRNWAEAEVLRLDGDNTDFLNIIANKDEFASQLGVFPKIIDRFEVQYDVEILDQHRDQGIIFEGAQGVLLDEEWGFHPHVTRSKTTGFNAWTMIYEYGFYDEQVENVGIIRAYQTRHGAGPLPTETKELDFIKDENNPTNHWQGEFRIGYLDIPLTSYAIHANEGIDSLAITCFDQIEGYDTKIALAYDRNIKHDDPGNLRHLEELGQYLKTADPSYIECKADEDYPRIISDLLETPLGILSTGPDSSQKTFYNRVGDPNESRNDKS